MNHQCSAISYFLNHNFYYRDACGIEIEVLDQSNVIPRCHCKKGKSSMLKKNFIDDFAPVILLYGGILQLS